MAGSPPMRLPRRWRPTPYAALQGSRAHRWTPKAGSRPNAQGAAKGSCSLMASVSFRKQPAGPRDEHGEEHQMAEPDAPARIELEADLLHHTQDQRADKRAPERTHAPDDHGLEGEQQQQRAVARRHRRAHALQ